MMLRLMVCFAVYCVLGAAAFAQAPSQQQPLALEATIALPNTSGRIDHLSIDLARKRLFVAELGNGSVDVIDLRARKVIHRISGLDEPQGIVYAPPSDVLAIACAGDGTVRMFTGGDYSPRGIVNLDDDADNTHLDPRTGYIVVGHGSGGLAIIDPARAAKIADISLPGHPEGFQISGTRAYVNVPDVHQIDVVDLNSSKLVAKWTTASLSSNFPMALDNIGHLAVVSREQARLALLDLNSGRPVSAIDTCGDADDVFFDDQRKHFIVSCGSGSIDVFAVESGKLHAMARIPTSGGARTSLYVPELDRLFLATRAKIFGSNASIKIFRPAP
jgi:YVTN family beta-propeller protein